MTELTNHIVMTKYEYADLLGRQQFKGYAITNPHISQIKESKKEMTKWDVSYFSAGTRVIAEIKRRGDSYSIKSFDTVLMQLDKYNALKTFADQFNACIHYICIYQDGIAIWDITNLNIQPQDIYQGNLVASTLGNQNLVVKQTIYLNINNTLEKIIK